MTHYLSTRSPVQRAVAIVLVLATFLAVAQFQAPRADAINDYRVKLDLLGTTVFNDANTVVTSRHLMTVARFVEAPVLCFGQEVTISANTAGTAESNGDIVGTNGDDVILGTPGADVIDGLGGDDIICAGDGRDRIYGGPGADTIFGGFGIDYIYGEAGEDTLDGQGGSDRMYGGPDNDLMLGDSGADRMFGGSGDDDMRGMGGQDFMWGEAGNDLMQGTHQSDNMWGGPGDDNMFGAGGKDSLFGEAGNDSLNGGLNTDYLDGGADVDTANGGRGFDKPLIAPDVRASNGQLFDGSGCIAETIGNCEGIQTCTDAQSPIFNTHYDNTAPFNMYSEPSFSTEMSRTFDPAHAALLFSDCVVNVDDGSIWWKLQTRDFEAWVTSISFSPN